LLANALLFVMARFASAMPAVSEARPNCAAEDRELARSAEQLSHSGSTGPESWAAPLTTPIPMRSVSVRSSVAIKPRVAPQSSLTPKADALIWARVAEAPVLAPVHQGGGRLTGWNADVVKQAPFITLAHRRVDGANRSARSRCCASAPASSWPSCCRRPPTVPASSPARATA